MADRHIDKWEVSEYGNYFARKAARLEAESNPYVNITAIKNEVLTRMRAVEALRSSTVVQGGHVRDGRMTLAEALAAMQHGVQRFFSYLGSLPAGTVMDMDAFFPAGKQGDVVKLKPADLLARAEDLVSGFDSPQNKALPGGAGWKADLDGMRAALAVALDEGDDKKSDGRDVTSALAQARKEFLRAYNGMAKRMVYGLLVYLGREAEFRSYFLDLQVNENGTRATDGDAPADGAPGDDTLGDVTLDMSDDAEPVIGG